MRALAATLFFSARYRSIAGFMIIITALMYGVPMALLFIKRDLEYAIGYHFFIDFVRYLAALFWLGDVIFLGNFSFLKVPYPLLVS